MGYESQVGLVLTNLQDAKLRTALARVPDKTLQAEIIRLLDVEATRFQSRNQQQLYFWTWCKWYPDDPGIRWLEEQLEECEPEAYLYARMGEKIGDYQRDGTLDDDFGVRSVQFLTFIPTDAPNGLSALDALLAAARQLVAAYANGKDSHSIEWEDLDAAHRLALVAVRALQ